MDKPITIAYFNFWVDPDNDNFFTKFVEHNIAPVKLVEPVSNPDILICSVFGPITPIFQLKAKMKIFFSGENLIRYPQYNNIELLKACFDLIVGFLPNDEKNKILRFPLWLTYYPFYHFAKDGPNIITYLTTERAINSQKIKKLEASCVANHDTYNNRGIICDAVSSCNIPIRYPSQFRNNDNRLGPRIRHKLDYIRDFVFNICPENTAGLGYCTEKVWQALEAGCIPIYWGCSRPEPEIINPETYIWIPNYKDGDDIKRKCSDYAAKQISVLEAPMFLPGSEERIFDYYENFKKAIVKGLVH